MYTLYTYVRLFIHIFPLIVFAHPRMYSTNTIQNVDVATLRCHAVKALAIASTGFFVQNLTVQFDTLLIS